MSSIFQASQVLDMAVQAEEQGRRFYEACRQRSGQKEAVELFDFLIAQEEKHARLFKEMKQTSEEFDLPESYAGEMQSYADSFVKKRIFKAPRQAAQTLSGSEGRVEVIDLALGFEYNSIEFYQSVKKMVRPADAAVIDDIILEERNHVDLLNRLRAESQESAST
jgi:rubrerythrin